MVPTPLAGEEFAEVLGTDDAFERLGGTGGRVLLVGADGLPDRLDRASMERLVTLPAVVVALCDPPSRQPDWADLVCAPDGPGTASVAAVVGGNPLAATVLTVLLRSGGSRSVQEGLVAESTAYGLLQGGPEFTRWRTGRPSRRRPVPAGPAVRIERHLDQLEVTLDRPEVRNALDSAMRDELVAALTVASLDPTVTAVHLRGAGPSFCSGGDLDEFGSRSDPATAHLIRLLASPARALAGVAGRTTAHLHGDAVGSGIELAAFAHRVVAEPTTRISLPEVRLGLIPGAGGTVSLPRRIGRHRTLELALSTGPIDAATALAWGLVDEVCA
ncbi:MAG: enoyl-CoA hydratase/isomerase family protein [Acidimicrobiales bacterium]|jgi:hypothetical protein